MDIVLRQASPGFFNFCFSCMAAGMRSTGCCSQASATEAYGEVGCAEREVSRLGGRLDEITGARRRTGSLSLAGLAVSAHAACARANPPAHQPSRPSSSSDQHIYATLPSSWSRRILLTAVSMEL